MCHDKPWMGFLQKDTIVHILKITASKLEDILRKYKSTKMEPSSHFYHKKALSNWVGNEVKLNIFQGKLAGREVNKR